MAKYPVYPYHDPVPLEKIQEYKRYHNYQYRGVEKTRATPIVIIHCPSCPAERQITLAQFNGITFYCIGWAVHQARNIEGILERIKHWESDPPHLHLLSSNQPALPPPSATDNSSWTEIRLIDTRENLEIALARLQQCFDLIYISDMVPSRKHGKLRVEIRAVLNSHPEISDTYNSQI